VVKFVAAGENYSQSNESAMKELEAELCVGMNLSNDWENMVHYKGIFCV
jgi:hypothetical protein